MLVTVGTHTNQREVRRAKSVPVLRVYVTIHSDQTQIAQWSRVLLFLQRTWSQFQESIGWLTVCNSSSKRANALFWPPWELDTHMVHIHTYSINIHTIKKLVTTTIKILHLHKLNLRTLPPRPCPGYYIKFKSNHKNNSIASGRPCLTAGPLPPGLSMKVDEDYRLLLYFTEGCPLPTWLMSNTWRRCWSSHGSAQKT